MAWVPDAYIRAQTKQEVKGTTRRPLRQDCLRRDTENVCSFEDAPSAVRRRSSKPVNPTTTLSDFQSSSVERRKPSRMTIHQSCFLVDGRMKATPSEKAHGSPSGVLKKAPKFLSNHETTSVVFSVKEEGSTSLRLSMLRDILH